MHKHPANVNRHDHQNLGDRISDKAASAIGSWKFIIIQTLFMIFWVTVNIVAFVHHWDSYPFVFLNLMLSFQAAYATPILLLSQNRQTEHDRMKAEHDYLVNKNSLTILMSIAEKIGVSVDIEESEEE